MSTAAAGSPDNPTNDEQKSDEPLNKGGANIEFATESKLSILENIHDAKTLAINENDKIENKNSVKTNGEDLGMDKYKKSEGNTEEDKVPSNLDVDGVESANSNEKGIKNSSDEDSEKKTEEKNETQPPETDNNFDAGDKNLKVKSSDTETPNLSQSKEEGMQVDEASTIEVNKEIPGQDDKVNQQQGNKSEESNVKMQSKDFSEKEVKPDNTEEKQDKAQVTCDADEKRDKFVIKEGESPTVASENCKDKDEVSPASANKKPVLKLASFAGMSSKPVLITKDGDCGYRTYKATGCAQCFRKIPYTINAIVWETMQFCVESCLAGYQAKMNKCSTCKKVVNVGSLGKYCVRFGSDVKQFCSNICLEDHKKGLKVCCYCQKNITGVDGFLAPIGGKGQFKDFCAPKCLQKYQVLHGTKKPDKEVAKCAVCSVEKQVEVKLILLPSSKGKDLKAKTIKTPKSHEDKRFEDLPLMDSDKEAEEKMDTDEGKLKKKESQQDAAMAKDLPLQSPEKDIESSSEKLDTAEEDDKKITPKEELKEPKKEVTEFEESDGLIIIKMCSRACLSAYKYTHVGGEGCITQPCDQCKTQFERLDEDRENSEDWLKDHAKDVHVIYYKGMSKRFCSAACQNVYVMQNREIVPCMNCKVRKYNFDMIEKYRRPANLPTNAPIPSNTPPSHFCSTNCLKISSSTQASSTMPVIQSVSSLASSGQTQVDNSKHKSQSVSISNNQQKSSSVAQPPQIQIQTQTVTNTVKETMVKCPEAKEVRNKAVMTKPFMMTKGVSCRPHPCHKQTQTDFPQHPALVPIAVPCYMPVPLSMYQKPYPVPVPVPLPIPVPIFVPTTRNSYKGIAKQIRKIRAKIPSDPFEAEMLALAGGLDQEGGDSDDSLPDTSPLSPLGGDGDESENRRNRKNQLELMAPAPDLENDIKGDKIVPKALPQVTADPLPVSTAPSNQRQGQQGQRNAQTNQNNIKRRHSATDDSEDTNDENQRSTSGDWDGRRRSAAAAAASRRRAKQRRDAQAPASGDTSVTANSISSMANKPPQERPDAKHHLKFTYGVNAWKHWVVGKNAELEKARAQGKYMKPFETDILKLRADELNYTLCMFVREVKKPNGDSYAADSVLYLTYGIQEYLFENGRIDNIFTDQYYEPFTSALHEVVKDFKLPMNELGYYVTRIEEEHLWEAKQLGAHSPQVLLNTLVYFNTKYFMLRTVEDHQKLSFTHIMKHWKKAQGQKEGQKSVILRYYPPAKKGQRNDERKCYEQQESGENPLRCPVKLYEFYLSKCPESSKTRNDVFYLMPERSCVPDSPVWYSNSALPTHSIDKMLQRNLMVREVQEHMLADAS